MSTFSVPNDNDYQELGSRWVSARNLIQDEYGYEICQSLEDIGYLQRVIDDELIDFQNAYALECLDVVLGRVLAHNVDGLDWWIVDDEYGRDSVIRYGETTLQFNVLHLLGKRLSSGESVDAKSMYQWVVDKTEELKGQFE